jgi:metal transporter CNNM
MKEIFSPFSPLTSHHSSNLIAARSGTDEIRDDGEEDEPPSPRLSSRRCWGLRVASRGCLLLGAIVFLGIFITGCGALEYYDEAVRFDTNELTVSSKNGAAISYEDDTPKECSFECCASLLDTSWLNDENHLRGTTIRFLQAATTPCPAPEQSSVNIPAGLQYTFIVILLVLSAIFSGLTLGLLSLDLSGLEIVMATEDASLARAARAIYPVRKNGNLLLCTLLLGNVAVNSLLSILMADITSGLVGFLASTFSIVIFGEIIPQAVCSRFPLQVGEKAVPLVKMFIVLLAAVAWPMAFILNKVLGREIGTTYSQSEMTKLIELHVQGGHFDHETGAAMTGALRYHGMSVRDAMTPLHNTFMLSSDEKLGFDTVAKIFKTGYSRIPVYEVTKSNVIGLLFVKDLIFLDPEDDVPVKNFVQIFGRGLHIVWPEDKLGHVLKLLKKGRSHMALVRDVNHGDGTHDPFYEIKGIITLEDIIEIILGDEIIDETDELVEVNDPGKLTSYSLLSNHQSQKICLTSCHFTIRFST